MVAVEELQSYKLIVLMSLLISVLYKKKVRVAGVDTPEN